MLFNSIEFLLFFLPLVFTVFYLLQARLPWAALPWLTLSSLVFYAWWEPRYLVLLLGSALFNYCTGRSIAGTSSAQTSRLLLYFGVSTNLALLAYYKYTAFLLENVAALLSIELQPPGIILPLAISFFTFQQIAYLVDAYADKRAENSPLRYLLFVCFFPQLIAGPIVHHKEMMGQFKLVGHTFDRTLIAPALTLITLGLAKKVLMADSLALLADPGFTLAGNGAQLNLADAWMASTAYTLQLYFDFSGYCDVALGAALLFGLRLPINFNSPYQASSIIEFWRRWHITLSRFLRDYVYIPLGGNRRGKRRRYANLYLTMLLGGLWHGAGWTFVLWGSLHGGFLICNHAWRRLTGHERQGKPRTLWTAAATGLTFLCVLLAFVYFRAVDASAANSMISAMFSGGYTGPSKPYLGLLQSTVSGDVFQFLLAGTAAVYGAAALLGVALFIVFFLPNTMGLIRAERLGFADTAASRPAWQFNLHWSGNARWGIAMGILLWGVFVSLTSVSPFLYFQF